MVFTFMNSSHSISQVSRLNHPLLTDIIYNNVSQPPATLSYNGRALTRGTRGFIEYAQFRGFLPSSTNQSQTLHLAKKNLSPLESVVKEVTLHLTKFLGPVERASFFQTTRFFHDLKEESLKGRSDLINKLIEHVNGDLRSLHSQDRRVLQEIGASILSLDLSSIALSPEKLEEIVRIFPCIQKLVFMEFPGVWPLPDNIVETLETCLKKLKPLKSSLSLLDLDAWEISLNALRVLSEFPHLKKLHIRTKDVSNEQLGLLSNFSQLESLSLSGQVIHLPLRTETMQELGKKLKSLQTLHLHGLCVEQGALLTLSQFTNLRDLTLTSVGVRDIYGGNLLGGIHDPVFQEIGKLTKLRSLKIHADVENATDKALEYLSNLRGLEKLNFQPSWDCSKESFEKFLKSFPHLTDLSIVTNRAFCMDAGLFEFAASSCKALTPFKIIASSCKALTRLSFHYFPGVVDEFHQLAQLPNLERIEFESAQAGLKSIIFENLDQFPKLKKLVISDCQGITLEDVESARTSQKRMPEIEFTPYSSDSESETESEEED